MSVLILGSEGSMGKRYQAILTYLGKAFETLDIPHDLQKKEEALKKASSFIIATPTPTHAKYIKELAPLKKPILCEKPITKDVRELRELILELKSQKTPFRMMMQYQMLAHPTSIGPTRYDYFRTGSDGLVWDCISIIGLARSSIDLRNASPVWQCKINGRPINFRDMDPAYIAYMQKWFNTPNQDSGEIIAIHEKTQQVAESIR